MLPARGVLWLVHYDFAVSALWHIKQWDISNSYNTGTRDCMVYIALKPEGWVQYTPCNPSARVITSLYPYQHKIQQKFYWKRLVTSSRHMHLCSKTLILSSIWPFNIGTDEWLDPQNERRQALGSSNEVRQPHPWTLQKNTPPCCKAAPPRIVSNSISHTPELCCLENSLRTLTWMLSASDCLIRHWRKSLKTGLNHVFFST